MFRNSSIKVTKYDVHLKDLKILISTVSVKMIMCIWKSGARQWFRYAEFFGDSTDRRSYYDIYMLVLPSENKRTKNFVSYTRRVRHLLKVVKLVKCHIVSWEVRGA